MLTYASPGAAARLLVRLSVRLSGEAGRESDVRQALLTSGDNRHTEGTTRAPTPTVQQPGQQLDRIGDRLPPAALSRPVYDEWVVANYEFHGAWMQSLRNDRAVDNRASRAVMMAQAGDVAIGWQQAPMSVHSIHGLIARQAHVPYALYHVQLTR